MSASSYDEALTGVLAHEGGYTNEATDPGGPTNFGITIADYRRYVNPNATAADVRSMPLATAKSIYRQRYWNVVRGDDLPAGVDYAVFDYGVNSGVSRAAKVLQRLIGFIGGDVDGEIGDKTVAAAAKADPGKLINAICDERLAFLQGLSTWPVYGNGWGTRVKAVRASALAMARAPGKPAQPPTAQPPTAQPPAATSASPATPATPPSSGWGGLLTALLAWLANSRAKDRAKDRAKPSAPPSAQPAPAQPSPAQPTSVAPPAAGTLPPWLATMRKITGVLEAPGNEDNPDILAWRDEIAKRYPEMADYCAQYKHDEIPWCGLTVAYCMAHNGIRPVFGPTDTDKFLWADAWSRWGRKLAKPVPGCVMVLTRAGGGHVGLFEGEDETRYYVRGGNTSDSVSTGYFPKSRLTAAIWPA